MATFTSDEKKALVREYWESDESNNLSATEGAKVLAMRHDIPLNTIRGVQHRLYATTIPRPWNISHPTEPEPEQEQVLVKSISSVKVVSTSQTRKKKRKVLSADEKRALRFKRHVCPACGKVARGEARIKELFHTRCNGRYPQSLCYKCRKAHAKARRAQKKAANQDS